ncbi:hypothetical protein B0H11DRAFT_2048892 [Mycena galericulata]|nr:hypothetical protein B0H11DRAFT_2062472 [Mycena galericulata]KAJ7458639.1 hypothetical protein B0H11DRAFT_2061224 [Mycena galericulata]KAJ7466220.1 hypothetical protein B0H11DRAFT_2048892 [Mycena galericulata]
MGWFRRVREESDDEYVPQTPKRRRREEKSGPECDSADSPPATLVHYTPRRPSQRRPQPPSSVSFPAPAASSAVPVAPHSLYMAGISLPPVERSLAHSVVDFTPDTAQGRPSAHRPPTHRLLRSPRRRRGTSDPPVSSESQKASAAEGMNSKSLMSTSEECFNLKCCRMVCEVHSNAIAILCASGDP